MKELVFDEMEDVHGGLNILACISNTASGIGVLGSVAYMLTFASNPIGWGILGVSFIGLVAGSMADPEACD